MGLSDEFWLRLKGEAFSVDENDRRDALSTSRRELLELLTLADPNLDKGNILVAAIRVAKMHGIVPPPSFQRAVEAAQDAATSPNAVIPLRAEAQDYVDALSKYCGRLEGQLGSPYVLIFDDGYWNDPTSETAYRKWLASSRWRSLPPSTEKVKTYFQRLLLEAQSHRVERLFRALIVAQAINERELAAGPVVISGGNFFSRSQAAARMGGFSIPSGLENAIKIRDDCTQTRGMNTRPQNAAPAVRTQYALHLLLATARPGNSSAQVGSTRIRPSSPPVQLTAHNTTTSPSPSAQPLMFPIPAPIPQQPAGSPSPKLPTQNRHKSWSRAGFVIGATGAVGLALGLASSNPLATSFILFGAISLAGWWAARRLAQTRLQVGTTLLVEQGPYGFGLFIVLVTAIGLAIAVAWTPKTHESPDSAVSESRPMPGVMRSGGQAAAKAEQARSSTQPTSPPATDPVPDAPIAVQRKVPDTQAGIAQPTVAPQPTGFGSSSHGRLEDDAARAALQPTTLPSKPSLAFIGGVRHRIIPTSGKFAGSTHDIDGPRLRLQALSRGPDMHAWGADRVRVVVKRNGVPITIAHADGTVGPIYAILTDEEKENPNVYSAVNPFSVDDIYIPQVGPRDTIEVVYFVPTGEMVTKPGSPSQILWGDPTRVQLDRVERLGRWVTHATGGWRH